MFLLLIVSRFLSSSLLLSAECQEASRQVPAVPGSVCGFHGALRTAVAAARRAARASARRSRSIVVNCWQINVQNAAIKLSVKLLAERRGTVLDARANGELVVSAGEAKE